MNPHRKIIAVLKATIKLKAAAQKELKTVLRLPHNGAEFQARSSKLGYACPMWGKQHNAIEITAILNLYLELRGREYRHGIREETRHYYGKCMEKLRAEFLEAVA